MVQHPKRVKFAPRQRLRVKRTFFLEALSDKTFKNQIAASYLLASPTPSSPHLTLLYYYV